MRFRRNKSKGHFGFRTTSMTYVFHMILKLHTLSMIYCVTSMRLGFAFLLAIRPMETPRHTISCTLLGLLIEMCKTDEHLTQHLFTQLPNGTLRFNITPLSGRFSKLSRYQKCACCPLLLDRRTGHLAPFWNLRPLSTSRQTSRKKRFKTSIRFQ